jgi:hypothetical protein
LIDMLQLIIMSLFSLAVSMFISDNFKFSNYKFIFLLQKFLAYSLNFALIVLAGCMLYLVGLDLSILGTIYCSSGDEDEEVSGEEAVESSKNKEKSPKEKDVVRVTENTQNYTFEINKKIVDSAIEKGPELVVEGIKEVAPKLGVAAAAGKATAEAIKHTGGMAPVPRLLTVGGAAFATAAGTTLGMELGKAATENKQTKRS